MPGVSQGFPEREEEMEKKTKSKGDIFNFINDATRNPSLHKEMANMIKTKGEGFTPNSLLERFYKHHYDDVNLGDCKKILKIVKTGIVQPEIWDWNY